MALPRKPAAAARRWLAAGSNLLDFLQALIDCMLILVRIGAREPILLVDWILAVRARTAVSGLKGPKTARLTLLVQKLARSA